MKKLVIAEDDDAVAHLVGAALGDAGFLCLRSRNGEEALNMVRSELPDALVLDVMMPKMDGIEVCKRLKADVLLSRIPILMLTSLAGVENRVEGLDAGADDYLAKPFDLRELAARVKAMIRQSRRERDRNPTTNLPGGETTEDHVRGLLQANKGFSLLYVDIDNFRTYADVYGYRKADEVIAQTGKMLLAQCRSAVDFPPFVGHIGGDDYIVVCDGSETADLLSGALRSAFEETVAQFYETDDADRGYVSVHSVSGEERRAQLMTIHVALLHVSPSQYATMDDLASAITETKAKSRTLM